MSRIGKLPLQVPQGVTIDIKDDGVSVSGPLGTLHQHIQPSISLQIAGNEVIVSRGNEQRNTKALHGLYRRLLENMVTGVSKGFTKILLINGVGYRAEMKDGSIVLNLGYSKPVEYRVPDGVTVGTEAGNRITVAGRDKQQIGQVAAVIRSFRPPEPYKGKGIRYENETIKRKVGKAGVK